MEDRTSSQNVISLDTVRNGIVVLKNKGLRAIIEADGINFDLKSPEEQQGIVNAFQELLTTIDFPLQTMVYSRRANVDSYIVSIEELERKEQNELLRTQMADYTQFLATLLEQNNIMSKRFFMVVQFQPAALNASLLGSLNPLASMNTPSAQNQEEEFMRNSEQLNARVALVSSSLSQIGIENHQLNTDELVELFYNLYNPQEKEQK